MNLTMRRDATAFGVNTSAIFDHARIRALIDEASSDSNNESDEHAGLLSMIQEEAASLVLVAISFILLVGMDFIRKHLEGGRENQA